MEQIVAPGLQQLTGRVALRFGALVSDAARLLGVDAPDDTPGMSRLGREQEIVAPTFTLKFDTCRLCQFQFESGFGFADRITPFPESWKNPCMIVARRPEFGMSRDALLDYLAIWEQRATQMGACRRRRRTALRDNEFVISSTSADWMDAVYVFLGPERLTGCGGRWGDALIFGFATGAGSETFQGLKTISAFRDEFNTNARAR